MKIEIRHEKENPYLKRKEIMIEINHTAEPTPSKAALQEWLAKEKNVEKNRVEIKNIYSDIGRQHSKSSIFIWDEAKKIEKEVEKVAEQPTE